MMEGTMTETTDMGRGLTRIRTAEAVEVVRALIDRYLSERTLARVSTPVPHMPHMPPHMPRFLELYYGPPMPRPKPVGDVDDDLRRVRDGFSVEGLRFVGKLYTLADQLPFLAKLLGLPYESRGRGQLLGDVAGELAHRAEVAALSDRDQALAASPTGDSLRKLVDFVLSKSRGDQANLYAGFLFQLRKQRAAEMSGKEAVYYEPRVTARGPMENDYVVTATFTVSARKAADVFDGTKIPSAGVFRYAVLTHFIEKVRIVSIKRAKKEAK